MKVCFHTLQLFILCKGWVVQQVLLSLRPGGPICYISHVIQYVLKSFPVPLSELLGLFLERGGGGKPGWKSHQRLYQKTIETDSRTHFLFLSKVKQDIFINLQSVSLRDTAPHLELSKHLFSFPEFRVHTFDHMMAVFHRPDSSLHNPNSTQCRWAQIGVFIKSKQSD